MSSSSSSGGNRDNRPIAGEGREREGGREEGRGKHRLEEGVCTSNADEALVLNFATLDINLHFAHRRCAVGNLLPALVAQDVVFQDDGENPSGATLLNHFIPCRT